MKRKPSISHDKAMARELRNDPKFAVEYLKAAMEDVEEPTVLLIALRQTAEVNGGMPRSQRKRESSAKVCTGRFHQREIRNFQRWLQSRKQLD